MKTHLSTKFRALIRDLPTRVSQVCVDVLVPQHFVGDPVEDVENEEAERENRSGYGVDAFGPVHKALVKRVFVVHGHRGRLGEDGGSFCGRPVPVLEAVAQSVTPEVKTAALTEQFFLLQSPTQRKCIFLLSAELLILPNVFEELVKI